MKRQLFREEALTRQGRAEPLDVLLRVTAPHMWAVLAALAVALTATLAWALLGSMDETVDADCALVLPGERYAVLSEATGTVEEVLVEVGDTVQAGQPLARVRVPALERELHIARSVLDRLEAQSGASGDAAAAAAMASARAEVHELEAIRLSGQALTAAVAGEIASHRLIPGQAVQIGSQVALVRIGDDAVMEAVAFVPQPAASLLQPGHEATIVRSAAGGNALSAAVSDISDEPAAADDWLGSLGLSPTQRSSLVRLTLADRHTAGLADGELCRLRIVVGTHAPISLLGSTGSAGHDPR